jgi:phage shock protein PspC (stress-responsive transcriptional regulator)
MFIEPNFTLPMLVIGVVFVAITLFIAAFVLHRYVLASIANPN